MARSAAAPDLEFHLLGPLEIVVDGTPVPLVGARQRALLALLVLHANEYVSRERVIEEFWNSGAPPAAQASLRVAVSKLRRALGDHRGRLETVSGGYRLRIEPSQVDTHRFERLLDEARAEHEAARAAELLDEALALWRGPPLADLQYEPFAQDEGRRLNELLLAAREERIEAKLSLGRHEEAVSELEALVAENPLHERLRGLLMVALYRSGRQSEALDVYRRGRRLLLDELGLEPGEELRRLEQAILTHDPAIGAPASEERYRARARPRAGRRAALVSGLLLAAGVAGLVTWLAEGSGPSPGVPGGNAIAVVDAKTNALSRFPLAWPSSRVALDAHTLWIANATDLTIARFDLRSHRIEQTFGLGVPPALLTSGEGAVWALSDRHALIRVDPAFGILKATRLRIGDASAISVGDPAGLAVGGGSLWVEDGVSTLLRIDPDTSAVTRRLDLGEGIDGVAYGAGSVWVTRGSPATLLRIDPRTNAVTARIPIAGRRGVEAPYPIGLSVGAEGVWVLNGNTGTVTRVDPGLNAVTATTPRISPDPIRIAAGAGAVWVADAANDAVARIDPATSRVVQVIPVGGRPVALAAGPRRVWVSVAAS